MAQLQLWFISQPDVTLCKTSFQPEDTKPLVCLRGNLTSLPPDISAFRWTPAVQAMCILFLKYVLSNLEDNKELENSVLSGEQGTPASSLDYAISKQSNWLLDMFGVSYEGAPVIRKLIKRLNSERKRPGPVIISVNAKSLAYEQIQLYLDNAPLTDPDVLARTIANIEGSWFRANKRIAVKPRLVDRLTIEKTETSTLANTQECLARSERSSEVAKHFECLQKLIKTGPTNILTLDVSSYIKQLRSYIETYEDRDAYDDTVALLKEQIKHVCISAEMIYTSQIASSIPGEQFLYSCSSLIDTGFDSYLKEKDWVYLVSAMGMARKFHQGSFKRVFFLNEAPLSYADKEALEKIVSLHLQHGVEVGFVRHDTLSDDTRDKANMAWMGGKVLLHATNQIKWDLDLTLNSKDMNDARAKYQCFLDKELHSFSPEDEANIGERINEIVVVKPRVAH